MTHYNLFLDDYRIPEDAYYYTGNNDFLYNKWVIARSYPEFVNVIETRFKNDEFPVLIAFDHDLSDVHYSHQTLDSIQYDIFKNDSEKTGYHCAKWLIDFCIDKNLQLPKYFVHSMNPAGKINIYSILDSYRKFSQDGRVS